MARGKQGRRGQRPPPVPLPTDDADADSVSAEDVAFVQSLRGRKPAFLTARLEEEEERPAKRRAIDHPTRDDEEEYERKPRVPVAWKAASELPEVEALPSRTAAGEWEYKAVEPSKSAPVPPAAELGAVRRRKTGAAAGVPAAGSDKSVGQREAQKPLTQLQELQVEEADAAGKRERIAAAASALLEAPEKNITELKVLLTMAADCDATVCQLAAASAMVVFKDLAPGYRIRPPTEKELEVAVSKEVKAVRDFEAAFLKGYQAYLKLLLRALDGGVTEQEQTGLGKQTAIRCMCGLLRALPHFNYRTDILRALVPLLASPDADTAAAIKDAAAEVLASDTRGEATLETVQLLAELVKESACRAPPHTLDVLKALRFSDRLVTHLSTERQGAKLLTKKERNRKWIDERRRMRDEAKRGAREEAGAGAAAPIDNGNEGLDEKTLRELDAAPDAGELMKLQTRTLEAVCEIYFRVLKAAEASPAAADRPLLSSTLDGLTRVAQLIDYEVVADILEVLRQLVSDDRLPPELQAQCLLTVCKVLGNGQDAVLAVDTRVFDSNLYRLASALPTLNSGSVRWSQSTTGRDGVVEASRIWVKVLSEMLLSRGYRQVDTARIAAFVKRLAEGCLHAEPGESVACLAIIRELLSRHTKLRGLLENETGAAGVYLPDATEPEGACALSSCLWELTLLAEHAHAHVASNALQVAKMPVDDVPPPPLYGTASPEDLLRRYTTVGGSFQPAPPRRPSQRNGKRHSHPPTKAALPVAGKTDVTAHRFAAHFREVRAFRRNSFLREVVRRVKASGSV